MSVVFDDGTKWERAKLARRFAGSDFYLCCPGPSLADTIKDVGIRGPGRVVVAVNRAYPAVAAPDFWIGTDHPSCFAASLMLEPFPKFLRMCWRDQVMFGEPLRRRPATYFVDVDKDSHPLYMFDRLGDDVNLIAPAYNSFEAALHLCLWLGAKRIHLVGCDFGGSKDYYDDKVLTDHQRTMNRRLYADIARRLAHHVVEAAMRGIHIISCTPKSPMNTFAKYIPLADAVKASSDRVPTTWSPCLDARDAAMCRWMGKPKHKRGVVVGVIDDHAWMLDWWYSHFREHNSDLPVCFADFGVSPHVKQWCDAHGERFEVRTPQAVETWFRKPFAILQAPFENILWLDLDTEIRGSLDPFFEHIESDGLVLCGGAECVNTEYSSSHDHRWFMMLQSDEADAANAEVGCSGLVGARRGHPLIQDWAVACTLPREFAYRGDHEVLGVLVHRQKPTHYSVTGDEFTLVMYPTCDSPTVMHHAGLPGKARLRERLISEGADACLAPQDKPVMGEKENAHLLRALDEVCNRVEKPAILEIGVCRGGTALSMMRHVTAKGKMFTYVGVDTRRAWRPFVNGAAFPGSTVAMITKPSFAAHDDVRKHAPDGFDLIVIDGCHCGACAEGDARTYAPMLRKGGYMAFHDSADARQKPGERQPGTPHLGVIVRPTYLAYAASDEWEDVGEAVDRDGLGIVRRAQ